MFVYPESSSIYSLILRSTQFISTTSLSLSLSLSLLRMVRLASRTGRHSQRYNKGLRLVVGCIPYRYTDNELEVLMISSQKGQAMLFPKGGWELDESVEEAALRETVEEAGVVGDIDEDELGKWSFKSKSRAIYHEGRMFALLVTEQLDVWPEKHFRQRLWMKVDDAREVCQNWWMKEALDTLVDRLTSQPVPVPVPVPATEECT